MTEITTSEIKVIVIQIIIMALLGAFMLLYSDAPINQNSAPISAINQSTQVSSSSQSWITSIISIPEGMGELVFISLLVISPFLLFDAFIALRFAKDIATKWI
jgi:hypothetical protein